MRQCEKFGGHRNESKMSAPKFIDSGHFIACQKAYEGGFTLGVKGPIFGVVLAVGVGIGMRAA